MAERALKREESGGSPEHIMPKYVRRIAADGLYTNPVSSRDISENRGVTPPLSDRPMAGWRAYLSKRKLMFFWFPVVLAVGVSIEFPPALLSLRLRGPQAGQQRREYGDHQVLYTCREARGTLGEGDIRTYC
jgi:hypothetical protein